MPFTTKQRQILRQIWSHFFANNLNVFSAQQNIISKGRFFRLAIFESFSDVVHVVRVGHDVAFLLHLHDTAAAGLPSSMQYVKVQEESRTPLSSVLHRLAHNVEAGWGG